MKSENSTAQIKCTSDSSMHFYQSQSIHITNLEFIGCGGNIVRQVEEFIVEDTMFKGQENSLTGLQLIKTTAQIVGSTIVSHRNGSYKECAILYPRRGCISNAFIGGAIIATNSTVDISQSKFEDNQADLGGAIFAEQDSIINLSSNVFMSNNAYRVGGVLASTYGSTIIIESSEFQDNNARRGGVLASFDSTITIEASEFHANHARDKGGVLFSQSSSITIQKSGFYDNYATDNGGALYLNSSTITIKASEFHNNHARDGGVLFSRSSNNYHNSRKCISS